MPLIRKRVSVSISLISGWVALSVSSSTNRSVGTSSARHIRSTRSGKSRCSRLSAEILNAMQESMPWLRHMSHCRRGVRRAPERAARPRDEVGKVEMLKAQRRDIERDAGVDALAAPYEPLPQGCPKAPLGELLDQPVLLRQRHEARGRNEAELGIVPAD